MAYKNITAGTKVGKAVAGRIIESKTGTLGAEIAFKFKEPASGDHPETEERLNWVGWLSEKAIQNTMKTLTHVLDFNGDESFGPGAINTNKDVALVVTLEAGQGENAGKQFPRIQFVNEMNRSAFSDVAPETVKSKLGAVGFKAAFMAAKAEKKGGASNAPTTTDANEDDLPF